MPPKALSSWNAAKQDAYRAQHAEACLVFHVLLDESPSMLYNEAAGNLRRAFNLYLTWLQHHADPMSQMDVRLFSTALSASHLVPLGLVPPLTPQSYDPQRGDGTALYAAIGTTCTTAAPAGKHVLIVFTDGHDTTRGGSWTAPTVQTVLQTLQADTGWLAVFLGAFPEALAIGAAMGFTPGNCLAFPTDHIPEAFHRLQEATQRYLQAGPEARKLLVAGGIF
jgi:hypothetical protein